VYPNPARELIFFNANLVQDAQFEVVNLTGQVLASKKVETDTWTFSVSELPQGMYFARMIHATGVQTVSFQVVK
jgi:hypothetical protein